jgi:hypothetical protein
VFVKFQVKPVVGRADSERMVRMNDNINRKRSKAWTKFVFEDDETVRYYEVCPGLSNSDALIQRFDLKLQTESDGLSLSDIVERLRNCAECHDDVEKVSLHYTGYRYSVVVVLSGLREERLPEIYVSFEQACSEYGAHRPIITVLGPKQRDCFALSAIDSYTVYLNRETLDIPA